MKDIGKRKVQNWNGVLSERGSQLTESWFKKKLHIVPVVPVVPEPLENPSDSLTP